MNEKQTILNKIVEIVVECCTLDVNGAPSITKEEVLGKSRKLNLVMTRAILCHVIMSAGYSTETIAILLGRTETGVRNMIKQGHTFLDTSRAYRIAYTDSYQRCRDAELI